MACADLAPPPPTGAGAAGAPAVADSERSERSRRCSAFLDTPRTSGSHHADAPWAHGFREAVAAELAGRWPERANRLRECGKSAVVIACRCCDAPHLVPLRCGARTCPVCARAVAAAISDRVGARIAVHDLLMEAAPWDGSGAPRRRSWRMVTLTRRADDDVERRFRAPALRAQVRHTRRVFKRWWRLTPWGRQKREPGSRKARSRRDTSYVLAEEVSPRGMVHLHLLVFGEYVPQSALAAAWSRVLGERAIVDVRSIRGDPSGALREVLKYATKGEKGLRVQARHAAAVELALRNVRRVEIGGALRGVRITDADGVTDDVRPEDLHHDHAAACRCCGVVGEWRWVGIVAAGVVTENGGFGVWRPGG